MAYRTAGADWPLTGRTEEIELLRSLRTGSRAVSAVIGGPPGVGKSRLARAALAEATVDGWSALVVRGSAGLAGVPLGPFRTVLRIPPSPDLSDLIASVTSELASLRSGKGLIVFVDDGHELDEASAALVYQLAAAGAIVAVVTTRSDTSPPVPITDLWKDGLAERIELQNLSRREAADLLAAGLGGSVQDVTANRIWHVTAGNPLSLHELVLSSVESGALRHIDGEWRLRRGWGKAARLQEIVAARLGRLDPEELSAIEMLAIAGSLPLSLLTGVTTVRAIEGLESRALVTTEQSGGRLEVAIVHPLHAEVLRDSIPALRQRSILRLLVDAIKATGMERTSDRVRVACWSLESGLDVDPMTLKLGADATLFGIGQAIAARLAEIVPEAATVAGVPGGRPAVPQDLELAVRLAQTAYELSGGVIEGTRLASALAWTGAMARSEVILEELSQRADSIDDQLRIALCLGWSRFWGHFEVEEATAVLLEAAAAAESRRAAGEGCDLRLLSDVYQTMAGIELNTAHPAAALARAEQAAATAGVSLAESIAAPPAAAALAYLGRCDDAIALVEEALPHASARGHPLTVAMLLFAKAGALTRSGDLEAARGLVEWLHDVAVSQELLEATATFGVLLGDIVLRQGRPASASRILRESAALLGELDILGYRPWALASLARARVQAGEEESAAAALAESRSIQPIPRHFDISQHLAASELALLAGRRSEAIAAARLAVEWAQQAGMIVDEAFALRACMRLEPTASIAERLEELSGAGDNRLVASIARHARAVVECDPQALLEVASHFADMTAFGMAGEAATEAAELFERHHESRAARAAARAASSYLAHCEGAVSSLSSEGVIGQPVKLTKREREVAKLAASGRSTKEIAERMVLSPRTVENHLYHAYMKLGVTDRSGLADALAPAGVAN